MARVKRAVHGKKHRREVLKAAKGYYGAKSRTFRAAKEQMWHSLDYAYRDRRAKKGEFRRLWIARINAAAGGRPTRRGRGGAGPRRDRHGVRDRRGGRPS